MRILQRQHGQIYANLKKHRIMVFFKQMTVVGDRGESGEGGTRGDVVMVVTGDDLAITRASTPDHVAIITAHKCAVLPHENQASFRNTYSMQRHKFCVMS